MSRRDQVVGERPSSVERLVLKTLLRWAPKKRVKDNALHLKK